VGVLYPSVNTALQFLPDFTKSRFRIINTEEKQRKTEKSRGENQTIRKIGKDTWIRTKRKREYRLPNNTHSYITFRAAYSLL